MWPTNLYFRSRISVAICFWLYPRWSFALWDYFTRVYSFKTCSRLSALIKKKVLIYPSKMITPLPFHFIVAKLSITFILITILSIITILLFITIILISNHRLCLFYYIFTSFWFNFYRSHTNLACIISHILITSSLIPHLASSSSSSSSWSPYVYYLS